MADETNGEGVVEINFPKAPVNIRSVCVNGINLTDSPLPLRAVTITIDLIHGDLPTLQIERIPPIK